MACSGCASDVGAVQVYWQFVDASGERIFPGSLDDSCDLPGRRGEATVPYDLQLRVRITEDDCEGTDASTCTTVVAQSLGCDQSRGIIEDVPVSSDPYLMFLEVSLTPRDTIPFVVNSSCVSVPGPRRRRVDAGRLIDLAVNTMVVDAIDLDADNPLDRKLNLDACEPVDSVDPVP